MYSFDKNENYYNLSHALICLSRMKNDCNGRKENFFNSKLYEILREESSMMNSIKYKENWKNPDFAKKIIDHNKEYWGNEENRKAQSERRKIYFSNLENLEKQKEINRAINQSESKKEKMSLLYTGRIMNPETVKKIALANTGKKRSEEVKERMRNKVFTEEHRANLAEGCRNKEKQKWITNDVINTRISIEKEVPDGWRLGRLPKSTWKQTNLTETVT